MFHLYNCSPKKAAKGNKPGKGGNRFWKNIGLGFKTPREAIEGLAQILVVQQY
jgi:small subunit ribosomal protein S11e